MKTITTMKIRNVIWGSIAAVLLNFGLFCQQAQAAEVTGDITFSGSVSLDTSSAGTAATVTGWNLPAVQSAAGDFATFAAPGDLATFHAPWSFSSGAIPSFWSVDGFTFDLTSSSINVQGPGFVFVNAVGTISGNLFDPTPGTFHFGAFDSSTSGVFSFQAASAAVPEPATLRSLMSGSSLLGAFLFMRRRRA